MTQTHPDRSTAAGLYESLKTAREPFLQRARDAADLTLPSILPPDGHQPSSALKTPYQSEGSEGVVNLSSKLLLSLFPAGSSFFRLSVKPSVMAPEEQAAWEDEETQQAFAEAASAVERLLMDEFEAQALRPRLNIALRALVTSGNVLLHMEEGGPLRLFHLNEYVVERDGQGSIVHLATHETIGFAALPQALQVKVAKAEPGKEFAPHTEVSIYTAVRRTGPTRFEAVQEVCGVKYWERVYSESDLPWLPLTFIRVDGEDYGRGKVEEVIGDLRALESLSESGLRAAAIAAKHVLLNGRGSGVKSRRLEQVRDGGIVDGVADMEALRFLTVDKAHDLSIIFTQVERLQERLRRAFLDVSSVVQRNAERVTAEEVRTVALELDQKLGGVYSSLTQELQLPIVRWLMREVGVEFSDPVTPTIVAGLDALGRGHDFQKLTSFLQALGSTLGPEGMAAVDAAGVARQLAIALSIAPDKVLKSEEQIAQERQAALQQTLVEKGTAPAVTAAGNALTQGQEA